MPASGAVTRNTLRQQIADALRDEVLAGRLLPGEEFTVKHIAEQYGVSATPVREALVDLSAQGLLDSDQHRGFHVHQFTVADFRAMVEARSLIADGIFRRIAVTPIGRVRSETLVSVRRRAEEAGRAAKGGDLDILIGYDLRFWRELAALVANQYICDFLHRMRVQAWVFSVPFLRADRACRDSLWSGHEQLVDAITLGDTEAARAVVDGCDAHALAWADRLEPEQPEPGRPRK
ncbi:GntR family transcriptional regulator [Streptomyces sp. IB2014 016-6]|uniref:GntR family transcriptional regulator n=1 Tax=Streptomyces sp. IB2014 016-6 TaxID=2517818 RepID=UPI0011C75D87|nr:GntR family transcriptional regulator [Streptomyces sp. IB2014 016-6]TXL91390.1 GntR family transcriptional regulator [Streptomyces sp. IB2014 016-6]